MEEYPFMLADRERAPYIWRVIRLLLQGPERGPGYLFARGVGGGGETHLISKPVAME